MDLPGHDDGLISPCDIKTEVQDQQEFSWLSSQSDTECVHNNNSFPSNNDIEVVPNTDSKCVINIKLEPTFPLENTGADVDDSFQINNSTEHFEIGKPLLHASRCDLCILLIFDEFNLKFHCQLHLGHIEGDTTAGSITQPYNSEGFVRSSCDVNDITQVKPLVEGYECHLCNKKLSCKSSVKRHIQTVHHFIKSYKCRHCDFTCAQLENLKTHTKIVHYEIKIHKCQFCDYASNEPGVLKKHIHNVHYRIKENKKSEFCEYIDSIQRNLNNNTDSAFYPSVKLKIYKCKFCDEIFSKKGYLTNHMRRVHNEIKNYECSLCDFTSSYQQGLKNHVYRVHNKLKSYKCQFCHYVCSQNGDLNKHINSVHLRIKNHKCHICDYVCSQQGDLNKHVNSVHYLIKKHQCHICGYSCAQQGDLKKHINGVHYRIKNHKCELCGYACAQKGDLKKHMKCIHPKEDIHKHQYLRLQLFSKEKSEQQQEECPSLETNNCDEIY